MDSHFIETVLNLPEFRVFNFELGDFGPGYNGFCGSISTPFMEPETSKFSSQFSAYH